MGDNKRVRIPFSASFKARPLSAGRGGKSRLITRGFMSSAIAKEPAAPSDSVDALMRGAQNLAAILTRRIDSQMPSLALLLH